MFGGIGITIDVSHRDRSQDYFPFGRVYATLALVVRQVLVGDVDSVVVQVSRVQRKQRSVSVGQRYLVDGGASAIGGLARILFQGA